ncbi:MAG: heme lyase CcmF/NrfE family subunit [Anaerolineae bacterium]|nr:heme lyase CcmF/NrfE family subunit [Anaerolineae bacterium]
MTDVGYWALVLTMIVSVYVTIISIAGKTVKNATLVSSARNGVFVSTIAATVATAGLIVLLLTQDFGVKYVYEHTSSHMPIAYTISALWAGQEGSLLLWLWLLTLLTTVIILSKRIWTAPFGLYTVAVMSFSQAFLALILIVASNPFELLPSVPLEGQGLNPLLQNFWMVAHPPVVFMGYAAYTAPFALAIGGLIANQMGEMWLRAVRRWALWAWLFLGTGILMGAYWAYLELGWGGYWGWDPVENSSLIPWLTGTALLHSLMMQRRRQAFKHWNLWLIVMTFLLCVFATFVTRSGIIQSVHAFGRSVIGFYFLGFMVLCLIVFGALLFVRRRELDSKHELTTLFSREAGLLLTNLLLCGTALVVLIGTLFPTLAEAFQGRQAALGATFYERTVGPLAQILIVLIGLCPWLAWGGGSPDRLRRNLLPPAVVALATAIVLFLLGVREAVALIAFAVCAFVVVSLLSILIRDFARLGKREGDESQQSGIVQAGLRLVARNRRRYGAHIVHLGIVLIAIGVTGSSLYQQEVQVTLAPGEQVTIQGYVLEYQDFESESLPDRQQFKALLDVYRGQHKLASIKPEKSFHWSVEQWVTEVAIRSTLEEDLYVILAGFEQDGLASFRILINPLVVWLWIGGAALLLGGVMAWWPSTSERNLA